MHHCLHSACFELSLTNFTVFDRVKEQCSVENSGNKNKRSRTLSEREDTTDHAIPPAATSETHGKEDNDEEEDNGKRKV